jgi:imidazolonepropionase-like amidohydrolase
VTRIQKFLPIVCSMTALICNVVIAQQPIAIKGGKIITMAGEPIEEGVILFRDGKILDVGKDLKIPVEAKVIDASGKVVMPGFIEAHSSQGMSQANENNPIVPYVSVLDSIDPMNSYFQRCRRNGVTTVLVSPGNSTIIGGQAAVIKTGGAFLDDMVVKSDAGVKISLRPVSGSRMGHLAKLRKALNEAKDKLAARDKSKSGDQEKKAGPKADDKKGVDKKQDEKKASDPDAKKSKSEADKKASDQKKEMKPKEVSELDKAMFALLQKKLPALIYCEKAMDVGQAQRLIKEFDLDAKLVLGRECYKAAKQIAKLDTPVVLDATLVYWEKDPRTEEETKIIVPKIFRDQGVRFTFQIDRNSSSTLGSNYLWYQAATAVKYGMPLQEALEALTLLPARWIGVEEFVGSIEKGKDGDVVILSGDPLKVDTWVDMTIVNGEVVYRKSEDEQLRRLLTGEETE